MGTRYRSCVFWSSHFASMVVCAVAMARTSSCTNQKRRSCSRSQNLRETSVAGVIQQLDLLQAQQSRLHREDHRLGPGTYLQLGEDTPQVGLHGSHAQSHGPGDLLVRGTARYGRQDFGFTLAQALPGCWLIRIAQAGQEPPEDLARDLGAENRVALVGVAHRCRQIGALHRLEKVTGSGAPR